MADDDKKPPVNIPVKGADEDDAGQMPGEQPVAGEHDPQAPTNDRAAGHTSEVNPN